MLYGEKKSENGNYGDNQNKNMPTSATCEVIQYLGRIAIKYQWCVRYCIS